jgi:hypothetical protein
MDTDRLPRIIEEIYGLVRELEGMFPGRHFTPDGHLVGSIGECLAAYHYGLSLLTASTKGQDAEKDGRSIEIKATQGKRVAFRCEPEHLLVIKLDRFGGFEEIYNGPGGPVWDLVKHKPLPKNGQYQISLTKLSALMEKVPMKGRLEMVLPMASTE